MQRFIALVIMLLVPLQSAWSVTVSLHGPLSGGKLDGIMHVHEHSHQNVGHPHHEISAAACEDNQCSHDNGHHDPHCHPVFNSVLSESCLTVDMALTNTPILQADTSFYSHTPPLFDRPPLVRA